MSSNNIDGDISEADVIVLKNTLPINPSLSEVGCPPTSAGPPGTSNPMSENMVNAGNNSTINNLPLDFFMQMMQTMKTMSDRLSTQQNDKIKITDVFLPSFDPDNNVSVREWCEHVDKAIDLYNLKDYEVRMKVGSLLKGRAKLWVDNWLVTTGSWQELRDNLILTFEPENRYSRDVVKFREHSYDQTKDIAEFLTQAWVLWRRVTKDKLGSDEAVEAVIGCVNDERLRIELMNAHATSVPELISVASTIRTKRGYSGTYSSLAPNKRIRLNTQAPMQCRICKRNNHNTRDCRFKTLESDQSVNNNVSQNKPVDTSNSILNKVTCTFCKKAGHTYDKCFKRERSIVNNINCVGKPKTTSMTVSIGKHSLNATFDSGAECSVMCESIAEKLPGKRIHGVNYLRGIGRFPVISLLKLETVCLIDNINVEISFCIVSDSEMTTSVLIGMDLFANASLSVIVTSQGAKLFYQQSIYHMKSNSQLFETLDCDLQDDSEIEQLRTLLNKYEHLFIRGFPTTRVNTGELEIRLKNPDKFVERRPYRLSPIEREKVKKIIDELLAHKIIRESKSPYSSPIILVKKKNGDDRLCVDYRELNSNTLRDHYPLPLISDQIDQLVNGYYYNSFDMAAGFHQIRISEHSIEKTAFITPDGLYEYLAMPFGLSNACAVYQRCINRALRPLLGSTGIAQVYVDDVLNKCINFAQGMSDIERIFIALQNAGFSINVEKSSFFKRSIEYLGNVICDGKVSPSPRKVEALLKSPVPNTVKQVRQFNGLAGYFRRFIPNFSRIMIPLYELTKKGVKWEWNERHEEARNIIIELLTSSPVLTLFQENLSTELYTDASSLGYGAILMQVIEGRRHAVAYMSMRTTDTESRYHSYELETLAVVRAIKHFKQYLYGRKFKVITDCNALKASKHKKELLPRIYRWWAFLQNYDFEIEYRKGEHIQHADFFSRNPNLQVNIMTRDLEWLKVEQQRDITLRPIIDALSRGENIDNYILEDDTLMKTTCDPIFGEQKLIVVPKAFQWTLINTYHSSLKHPGWEKTLQKIQDCYWFDKMNTIIRTFVDNCIVCRTSKGPSGAKQVRLHPIQKPTAAFEVIHMDITGKLGTNINHEYVIVTIDAFSKYVMLHHANNKNPGSTLAALKRTVHIFGTPVQIIVDGGREFLGEFKLYCDQIGINIHVISPGVSRANGQVERVIGTLKNALVMINNYETENWHTALDSLQLAFNCTPHRITGVAPLTLLTRRKHCVPPELANLVNLEEESFDIEQLERLVSQKMLTAGEQEKLRFNKNKARVRAFQRGDYVLIKNNPRNQTCLDLKFSEPYEVCRILDNDRYLVKKVVGRGRPRKVAHDQLRAAPTPEQQSHVSAGSTEVALEQPPLETDTNTEPVPSTSQDPQH